MDYLHNLYESIKRDARVVDGRKQPISETYGEILPASIDVLFARIKPTTDDVFVDLGSGLGKVVLQTFLNTPVKESRGIEVIPALHQKAHAAADKMRSDLPALFQHGRKLSLILGDFLASNLSDATVVLIGSPCFGPSILDAIARLIDQTLTIHTVFSLRPLLQLKRLAFKQSVRLECTWDSAQCYIYGVRPD